MKILEITSDSRLMHGIRHHDYNRYRHYCSKKIKSESGLLFKAERAYYYSIQLNQESEQDYRKKQHSNKRLKKAIAFAQQILDAVSPNEVVSFLEASGYHRFLKSHYLMQKQAFKEAFENFQETKSIYEKLELIAYSTHHKTLIEKQIDEIEPCIRFCAYQLRQDFNLQELLEIRNNFVENDLLASKIQALVEIGIENARKTIVWRDYSVQLNSKLLECSYSIENYMQHIKDMNIDYLAINGFQGIVCEEIEKANDFFDKVMGVYWEATKLIEKEYKNNEEATRKAKSSKSDENTAQLKLTWDYIAFGRIMTTIKRNNFLIKLNTLKFQMMEQSISLWDKKAPKRDDNIKLSLTNLKNLEDLKKLFVFETDINIQSLYDNLILLHEATKKIHFAQYYQLESQYSHGLLCVKRSRETLAKINLNSMEKIDSDFISREVVSLDRFLLQQECQIISKLYLHGKSVDLVTEKVDLIHLTKKPLSFQLKSFEPINGTPDIIGMYQEPIPYRPIVYDLAYSRIEFPSKSNEENHNPKENMDHKSQSFFKGIVQNLWK